MSIPTNSSVYMAHTARNGISPRESFQKFFELWLTEQDQHLQDLVSASEAYEQLQSQYQDNHHHDVNNEREAALYDLLNRVIHHYEQYYHAKSLSAKEDVLSMLSPSWKTSLEEAFLWIGGWRPSLAFHLLYSKSGIQLEAALEDFIRGVATGDLGDLSPRQLERVDGLHRRTIREEKEITEKMAKQQETVANTSMVELSHAVTEMMREERGRSENGYQDRVETEVEEKERGLEDILQMADDLRMRTLKGVVEILSPIQGVQFLIAAAELHLRLHDWGKTRDARRNQEEPQLNHVAVGS